MSDEVTVLVVKVSIDLADPKNTGVAVWISQVSVSSDELSMLQGFCPPYWLTSVGRRQS
jgi:hypothetical protein